MLLEVIFNVLKGVCLLFNVNKNKFSKNKMILWKLVDLKFSRKFKKLIFKKV